MGLVRGLVRYEVEFSVVKEDRDAEVGEVSVTAGDVLEVRDQGVEALSGSVRDQMPEPGEDAFEVCEDHFGDPLQRHSSPA